MTDKLDIYNRTLTDWDEFRKWCEDRRGPMAVARDLPLFIGLFREAQDRIRHAQLVSQLKSEAAENRHTVDGKFPSVPSLDGEKSRH